MDTEPLLVTVAEAAKMLGLSEKTVYDLARDGTLTKRYVGKGRRNFRIEVDSLKAYTAGLPTEPVS